jgi:O-antigen/teichoic acid export membrane protein
MEKAKTQYLLGIILSGGGNLLGMVASLITIMVAARLLSQVELGAFFLVMLVAQFTALLGDIGLKNTAIKALSALPATSIEFIQTSGYILTVTMVTSLIACLAVSLIMPLLAVLWPYQEFLSHTSYIAPIALLTTGLQLVMSLLVSAKKFKRLSVLSAGTEILRALLSTGGLLAGLGISSLLWGMIVSRLIGIGAIWFLMPSLFSITFRHPESAALLKCGGWLYGCSLVSVIMVRASDAILTTYMGTAALAVYSAAMQVPSVLQRVFESIRPALLGYISAQQTAYANPQIAAVRIVTAFLAVTATFLIALSRPIMTLLYSEKYESGVTIMQALSVWAAFTIINYLFSIILIGNGESRKAFLLTLPQLLMIIISASLLVPLYEGFGAGIALITTAFLGNIIGARLVAGDDKATCHTLTMVFLRAAAPLLVLLLVVLYAKPTVLILIGLTTITILLLIAFKVVTQKDINTLSTAISGLVGRGSARLPIASQL